jgi:hypothetical protein
MLSYIMRHWSGALNAWLSLLDSFAVYLLATLAVVAAGNTFRGDLSFALLLGGWLALVGGAAVGTVRSALRAIKGWRTRRWEAVGGGVAILVLGFAAYFAAHDVAGLAFRG